MILALPLIFLLLQPEPVEFRFELRLQELEQVDDSLMDTI